MKLTVKQTEALDILEDHETTEIIYGGAAGGGKSILGCVWIVQCCLKFRETRWVIGRSELKQLRETTLNTLWWVLKKLQIPADAYQYNENKGLITFKNGSEILLKDLYQYPQDISFDSLGSLEITGAFVDEASQVSEKAWNILKSRIRYRLDEFSLVPKILGTCNPSKGWVYTSFFKPFSENKLTRTKKFIPALLSDNPYMTKHYRQSLLTLDKASIERLLYGNWDYDSDPRTLISLDAINDCFTNDFIKPTEKKRLSADLAMQGRDRFIVAFFQGDFVEIKVDKLKSNGKEIETDLIKLMETYSVPRSKVIADSDGMGAYLESYLKGIKEFHGNASSFDKQFINLKAECAFRLAEKINKRQLRIECSEDQKQKIIAELSILKQRNVDGDEQKKAIIRKDEMKDLIGRSPDYLDALLMGMYFELCPQQQILVVPGWN